MRGNAEDYDAKNKSRYKVQKRPDQEEPENPDLISFWDLLQIFSCDKESYSGFNGADQVLSVVITLLWLPRRKWMISLTDFKVPSCEGVKYYARILIQLMSPKTSQWIKNFGPISS